MSRGSTVELEPCWAGKHINELPNSVRAREVIFRFDVCTPTASLLLNRLHLKFGYLHHLKVIVSLLREHGIRGTFMFIPYRTTPTEDVLGELSDLRCEVAVHADEVLPGRLSTQREMMERIAGREVSGVAYHGRDLSDILIHKLTGKTRYISYHNPFVSLQAGFKYDATGFTSGKPEFLEFGGRRILLFQSFRDLTAGPRIGQVPESMFEDSLNIFLVHPRFLKRYGFMKGRIDSVRNVFDYVRKLEISTKTYREVYERFIGDSPPRYSNAPIS
jgi:hypothetical protein